ncbi:putative DUF6594 domain-containing protein [Seiridium unicorne]|uniref:DUF6594 domain-containing protein n=1 Tax=Seiridium unicorne TaxID=138068 RepID=A0ABR2UTP7_9PEZI
MSSSVKGRSSSVTEQGVAPSQVCTPSHDTMPTDEEIQRKPWKFVGYKSYADFVSSDSDFFILRRFDALNVRISLAMQDKLSVLEEELNALDGRYSQREAVDINNGTFRDDMEDREVLLEEVSKHLYRYNKFIMQQSALRQYSKAPRRDIKSIKNWHYNHGNAAISAEEQRYLDHSDDLICVAHKDKTPLRRALDSSLRLRTLNLWRERGKDESVPQYDMNYVSYYSDKRMDQFASIFIMCIGLLMLITPIWILQALEPSKMKLVVITIFVFVFLMVMSFAMVARPFEALGATAAQVYPPL